MVNTSNWPPLVAMSVVTFWRSTFSSSVTQLSLMSGLALVKSSVSFCMRIMSPLLTVAMVNVVSARAGSDKPASATAPIRLFTSTFIAYPPMRNATNWAIAILAGEYSPGQSAGVNPEFVAAAHNGLAAQ